MTTIAAKSMLNEATLVLIKPDAVERGLTGAILDRFERVGLEIVALKKVLASDGQVIGHFPKDQEWIEGMGRKTLETYAQYGVDPIEELGTDSPLEIGREIFEWNKDYLRSGPVVAVALRGLHAVDVVRKLIGDTLPYRAAPGTIRGDYAVTSPAYANATKQAVRNLVHASGNKAEAEAELRNWFTEDELVAVERR
ncbi:MAG: nucleoside-diphosphate kinase [Egibacteraceae bacterium]